MEKVLKVRKKGVIILPKRMREAVGIEENGELIARVEDRRIILEPFKPVAVRIDQRVIEEVLREEGGLEEKRIASILKKYSG